MLILQSTLVNFINDPNKIPRTKYDYMQKHGRSMLVRETALLTSHLIFVGYRLILETEEVTRYSDWLPAR